MKLTFVIAAALLSSACTVKMAAPEKPITINLNVKIEHEVRVKVEKQLDDLFQQEDDLF
ncbi:YnbE family lipoprotein [Bacterioplanes sanyensis]|uniref:YnbE family lipoprotein n=1 Tax=Bacterioplanes sanyensis TaxID=1249553 RepID=A0A222FGN7_9GAMM|nr:YnbE family lipoprotein [Bacterioplanes sanyensis]ASP38158.1 YnbE family lipoprotein [Bacterioplanes sanyensis]